MSTYSLAKRIAQNLGGQVGTQPVQVGPAKRMAQMSPQDVAEELDFIKEQVTKLMRDALNTVRKYVPEEESRARAYWYNQVLAALGDDNFRGGSMFSLQDLIDKLDADAEITSIHERKRKSSTDPLMEVSRTIVVLRSIQSAIGKLVTTGHSAIENLDEKLGTEFLALCIGGWGDIINDALHSLETESGGQSLEAILNELDDFAKQTPDT